MKKHFKLVFTLMFFGLFAMSTSLAQNYPDATMSSDEGISLTEESPLGSKYEIDFSTLNWTPQIAQQAAMYLDQKSSLITVEVDYENSRLILHLAVDNPMAQSWKLKHWNDHLSTVK